MRSISRASFAGSLVLAVFAGFVDAIGFVLSGGLFVSFMSGNSTQAGVEASSGDSQTAIVALCLVVGFVFGVFAGRFSSLRVGRVVRMGGRIMGLGVTLACATLLVAMWPDPGFSLAALASVMGAMNTLFIIDGRAQVAITYATGTLVSLGIGLADHLLGRSRGGWIRPFLLWSSLTAGALTGALCWRAAGIWSLIFAAVGMCALGAAQMVRARHLRHRAARV